MQSFWIFDAAPVAMAVVDPLDDYRLLYANPLWYEQFGRESAHSVGRNGPEIALWVNEQDRAQFIAAIARCPSHHALDAQLFTGSGTPLWCRLSARHSLVDGVPRVVIAMQNIQAQWEVQQSLRDSQELALKIFDVVPETLLISDAKTGEFIDVNSAWAAKMGYSKAQVVGKTSRDINLWVNMADVADMATRFAANGQVDGELLDMRRADGVILNFEVSARQWHAADRHLSIWIARDITERRRSERALKELNATLEDRVQLRTRELADALEVVRYAQDEIVRTQRLSSLGTLVAGVAHELNTPIGNALLAGTTLEHVSADFNVQRVQGLTRSALERYTGAVKEATEILVGNLQRSVELINGFKQLAVDQSSYQRRTFDLRTVVEEVLLTINPTLRRTPHSVRLEVPSALEMDSFPGPLGQVLINLINNAVLHGFDSRHGGVIVIGAQADEGGNIVVTVQDNGVGIPAANMDRIFDPFFTTRLGQGGSGLGLHICFSLVNSLLGGSISVASASSGGTCFTLRIPRYPPNPLQSDLPQP